MKKIIIQDTGEIIEDVTKIITKKQSDLISKKIKDSLFRDESNFIFLTFKRLNELNLRYNEILDQADITRIIYMSTFLNYDNKLMKTERKPMTKEMLFKKMNMEKSGFNKFYKRLLTTDIIIEKDNELFLNKKYCFCGRLNKNTKNDTESSVIRIYKAQVQYLYETIETSKHKQLAVFFMLIPFLNNEYNIVCENPLEEEIKEIIPLSIENLAEIYDYNIKSFIILINSLSRLTDIQGEQIIKQVENVVGVRKYNTIVVNPKIIYAGHNYKNVEFLSVLFNYKKID